MHFRLLGSLEVLDDDGRPLDVRGAHLRTLLAALLTNANNAVSRDLLIDAVWGSEPPATANHGIDVLLSRLRSLLSRSGTSRLLTRSGGYLLLLNPVEFDALRFERAIGEARAAVAEGDLERAADAFRRGLGEWRGAAYGELACASFAVETAMRLEELRRGALEELFECELALEHHRQVLPEVESFVEANPLSERARCSLMLALYRAGRQADAVATYRAGAELLEEQGLEPGSELRRLQVAMLRQDPRLLAHDGSATSSDRPLTLYARNGDVSLAYQVSGAGTFDVVYAPPFVTNVDLTWDVPTWAALLRRLGSFSRLIRFDKRGTGMSDRTGPAELAIVADDLRAVMDATGSWQAAIIGASDAGPLAIAFAAAHPERVWALVLWGAVPRVRWAPDYPWGVTDEELADQLDGIEKLWTEPGQAEAFARGLGAADVDELAALWRQSASPGAVRELERRVQEVDVRAALMEIAVPVLVLNRTGDDAVTTGSRYLADHLPNARHLEFPGSEHVMFGASRDYEAIAAEIESFLSEAWERHAHVGEENGR